MRFEIDCNKLTSSFKHISKCIRLYTTAVSKCTEGTTHTYRKITSTINTTKIIILFSSIFTWNLSCPWFFCDARNKEQRHSVFAIFDKLSRPERSVLKLDLRALQVVLQAEESKVIQLNEDDGGWLPTGSVGELVIASEKGSLITGHIRRVVAIDFCLKLFTLDDGTVCCEGDIDGYSGDKEPTDINATNDNNDEDVIMGLEIDSNDNNNDSKEQDDEQETMMELDNNNDTESNDK